MIAQVQPMDEMWVSHVFSCQEHSVEEAPALQVCSSDKDKVEITFFAARPLAYLTDQCLHKTRQIHSFIVRLVHLFP